MKIAKQAVSFYCIRTGKEWYEFFNNLDRAVATPYEEADDEIWTIKKALEIVLKTMTLQELKANKDEVKSEFDIEGRKNAGEFFTPLVWCREARKYFDKYITNWSEYKVWDMSCYSMRTKILIKRTGIKTSISEIVKSTAMYTIGWVSYDELRDTDKVWGYCKETGQFDWVGFKNRFTKRADVLYHFSTSKCKVAEVTADHKIVAYLDGKMTELSAKELYEILITKEYKLAGAKVDKVEILEPTKSGAKRVELDCKHCNTEKYNSMVWDLTMDKWHYFVTRTHGGSPVILSNCGTGNLMLESEHPREKIYLSTLQDTDVETVSNMKEYEGANVFQLDFLSELDYDSVNTEFLNKLPEGLQSAIRNNEKLIFFANPPYKSGMAKATEVGRYMSSIGLSQPAYDLFYQFCWRIMHFVEMFDLTNAYFCVFGSPTFFTGSKASVLFKEYTNYFKFIDGMCISAQDFSGTSTSIEWGIACTLWKAKGAYSTEEPDTGVLLQKKMLDMDGNVIEGERSLYTAPREKMDIWLQPKDVLYYREAPLATSHLTLKGSDEGVLVSKYSGKIADNAFGTMMLDSSLARGNTYSAILSLPTTLQFVNITEENFWRCVSSYAFRNTYKADWSETRKWLSAPDTSVEGYETWLANALVIFLFELKSMQSSMRDVNWFSDNIDIQNKLFPITEEEFKASCHDEVILQDFETHGFDNAFILQKIDEVKELWKPEVKELFDWCKEMILYTYDVRQKYNYKGCLQACDAGLAQLRYGLFNNDMNTALFDKLSKARNAVNKDLNKFGFLCETEAV